MGHANAPPASPCINKKTTSLYGLAGVAISPLGIVDVVDYILPNGDIVTELELGSSNAYSKSR